MASATPNRISLKGEFLRKEYPLKDPGIYDVFVTPGMLIEVVNGEVQPHSTSGGNASPLFADVNPYLSDTARGAFGDGADIDTDYTEDGEVVLTLYAQQGAEVYAWLAAGQDTPVDGLLQSNGDGYLAVYSASTPPPLRPVCRALQAVDNNPGTGGAAVRIKVEVI